MRLVMCLFVALTSGVSALDRGSTSVSVSGRVVDLVSGDPIGGARVSLGQMPPVETDLEGRFTIPSVADGLHILLASAPGYLTGAYGQRSALGPSLMLLIQARDRVGVTLRLWKVATVEGIVRDEADLPIVGAAVSPYRQVAVGGRLRWRGGRDVRTDAHGSYRLPELTPGTYILYVRPPERADCKCFPAFVGGADSHVGATRFDLSSGERVQGVSTTLHGGPSFRVTGRLIGVDPRSDTRLELRSKSNRPDEIDIVERTVPIESAGTFSIDRVPLGSYTLRAVVIPKPTADHGFQQGDGIRLAGRGARPGATLLPLPPGDTMWVDESLDVLDKAPVALELLMRPAARFVGRVVSSGNPLPKSEALLSVPVMAVAADGRDLGTIPVARVEPDGTFNTAGLPPGQYVIHPRIERLGWSVESVSVGSVDATGRGLLLGMTDQQLRIVVTDRPASLSGVVADSRGNATAEAFVIVFPLEENSWSEFGPLPLRLRDVLPNESGRFRISHLPPGRYLAAAFASAPPETWRTADFLKSIRQAAISVVIGRSEQAVLNLVAK